MKTLLYTIAVLLAISATATAQPVTSVVEVYRIFQEKCVACHDHASPEANLDLEGTGTTETQRALYVSARLTNVNPTNTSALNQGYKRVYPGRADRSFLFKKINQGLEPTIPALDAQEGSAMPASAPNTALTDIEKEVIRQWILYGAKTTGVLFDKAVVEDFYTNGGGKSFPDGPPPAPAPGTGFQIKMGPFFLPPDGEVEYYQKYELALPANVEVNELDFKISPYSHHFLLYNFTGNGANSIPAGLRLNANHSQINLVAAVQEATALQLPGKTAFKWEKNRVLDLNSHYINYSFTKTYQCESYINVYTQATGTAEQEMFATLIVNDNIPIPNNSDLITYSQPVYQPGADSIYVWGLMGHTHKYGKGYKAWKRLPNGQRGEQIYDASCPMGIPGCPTPWYDYQHIPLRYWEPLLPVKWSNGIIHEAQWVNDGPEPVNFGPTSDDEMMVLIAFYTEQPLTVGTKDLPDAATSTLLNIAPNPSDGHFTVRLPGSTGFQKVRLYNLSGQEVFTKTDVTGDAISIETTGLVPGMYLIDVDGRKGKIMVH